MQAALLRIVEFWLDAGVDGLRLDAIPYLYERDGTSGENLPETHAFLKELRRHIDERFADLAGFRRYDVHRPEWLDAEYGVIVCDPPFFRVSLSQLFDAVRIVAGNDFTKPLLISYLRRRASAVRLRVPERA